MKTALITGASQGIGRSISQRLAGLGYNLVLCARNTDKLAVLAAELQQSFPSQEFLAAPCDVRHPKELQTAVSLAVSHWQRLDLLINNAGVALSTGLLQEFPQEMVDTIIDTNLKGTIYAMQAVLPVMVSQQAGTIININSTAGKNAYPYWSVYAASKFGLDAITQAVAEEQRSNGIRVAGIYPGAVDTAIWNQARLSDQERQNSMLEASDIADAVAFLVSQPQGVWVSELVLSPLKPGL